MTQQKFASLIELRHIWDSLSNENIVKVVQHVLENDVIGEYKKTIISGIFKHIYEDGETNDYSFFADLLVLSHELKQSQSESQSKDLKRNESKLEQLPDGVISHIASYLPARNVFTTWNHVNRKFVQIGLKPQSIEHFFIFKRNLNQPKFNLNVTLSKLISFTTNIKQAWSTMGGLITKFSMNNLKSLTINARMLFFIYCINIILCKYKQVCIGFCVFGKRCKWYVIRRQYTQHQH